MKNFNSNITVKITTLILLFALFGCGSIDTTTTPSTDTTTKESEILGINNLHTEQNISISIEEINREVEVVDSQNLELEEEQNSTVEVVEEIVQEIYITPPPPPPNNPPPITNENDDEEIIPVEENLSNYTKKFINQERCNQILDKEFLVICYDYSLKVAKAVSYTLYGDLVNELNIEDRPSFYVERDIDEEYRAETTDYTNTGYDRGHLAPDASFDWSQESLDATYSLANIIPQAPVVNRFLWLKVENYARDKAFELDIIEVVNVVKYSTNPPRIGENNISISEGFYKILFNSDKEYEECFYYANDLNASSEDDLLENHLVDCTLIE